MKGRMGRKITFLKIKEVIEDKKSCQDCKDFVVKFKDWKDRGVPAVSITTLYKCRKCRLNFEVYNKMVSIWK